MNNHPTIDIIKAPSSGCPNPVWNCIEYCFRANNYIIQQGTEAFFAVAFDNNNYPDGITVVVAGLPFLTETPGGLNSFSWQGSNAQITTDFIRMLESNIYIGKDYDINDTFGFALATAREIGFKPNFIFNFPVAIPPVVAISNGTDLIVQSNYRLVLEVWLCVDSVRTELVAIRGYEPSSLDGEICVNLAGILQSLVYTTFPGLATSTSVVIDENIRKDICLRYGEIYSDGSSNCEASPMYFEQSSPISIINSAFQRDDEDGIAPFCYAEVLTNARFLTNRPNYVPICLDSFAWLWFYYDEDVAKQVNNAPGLNTRARVVFSYTDNTSSTGIIDTMTEGGIVIVPSGLAQIGSLANGAKIISSYTIDIAIQLGGSQNFTSLSTPMIYKVGSSDTCCCKEEFYFLGEPGGFDTILFNCLRESDLNYQYTEFCSYEPCEGDILEGGKAEAEARAYEVYRTTSKFLDTYENLNWIREFFKSPQRHWRKDDKVYKVVMLNSEIALYRKNGFIYVEFEYILSFELNQQKN